MRRRAKSQSRAGVGSEARAGLPAIGLKRPEEKGHSINIYYLVKVSARISPIVHHAVRHTIVGHVDAIKAGVYKYLAVLKLAK